jgi:hypothetical protein
VYLSFFYWDPVSHFSILICFKFTFKSSQEISINVSK